MIGFIRNILLKFTTRCCKVEKQTGAIQNVLCRYGFKRVGGKLTLEMLRHFSHLSGRLKAEFVHDWALKLESSVRNGFYRQIKSAFNIVVHLYHVDKKVFEDTFIRIPAYIMFLHG